MIAKLAIDNKRFQRNTYFFERARDGFKEYLMSLNLENDEIILLPAYIGWSKNEGSGVFDPIRELELNYEFYKLDKNMNVDINYLEELIKQKNIKVFVLIHYFGYVDKNYESILKIAKENNCVILEDSAHALYTDYIGGIIGRESDASIYSLHKMLPFKDGGMLIVNDEKFNLDNNINYEINKYDLGAIARLRVRNFEEINSLLIENNDDDIKPIKTELYYGSVPQTYPVLIKDVSRDDLYFLLNERNIGVVSLYHTMIKNIDINEFRDAIDISKTILNLPIHQDLMVEDMRVIVNELKRAIRDLKDRN